MQGRTSLWVTAMRRVPACSKNRLVCSTYTRTGQPVAQAQLLSPPTPQAQEHMHRNIDLDTPIGQHHKVVTRKVYQSQL